MRASPVALAIALILALAGAAAAEPRVSYVGSYTWERPERYFGGLSGLEVDPDGMGFLAISDNAQWVPGRFLRSGGAITGIEGAGLPGMKDLHGRPIYQGGDRMLADSEGLARLPDGSLAVSFEREARIWRYAGIEAAAEALPDDPDFGRLAMNAGLEALAADEAGVLYALPEWSDTRVPVYRLRDGAWDSEMVLERRDRYSISGADVLDGWLYILERRVWGLKAFQSRVRRFRIGGAGLTDEQVVLESWPGAHDNLEGISVWRDGEDVRITMVSDDNYRWWQRTEFVEYRLTE